MELLLEMHVLDVTPGAWCQPCALPSAVTIRMAAVNPETLRIVGRLTATECTECGGHAVHRSTDA